MVPEFEEFKLTNGIVTLRPFRVEDTEDHLRGEDDDQRRWLTGGPSTPDSIRNWIERNTAYWSHGGPVFAFAVILNRSGQLVGMIESNLEIDKFENSMAGDANISYGIYPKFRRMGYAVMSVNLVVAFLKARRVSRATIRVSPDNLASSKIPQKCGFESAGKLTTGAGEHLFFVKKLC